VRAEKIQRAVPVIESSTPLSRVETNDSESAIAKFGLIFPPPALPLRLLISGGWAMPRTRTVMFVALATVAMGGCGTIRNFAGGDPDIYGGVQKDIEFIETPRTAKGGVGVNTMTLALFVPADLCLSFVADTLTLPVAICMRQNDHNGDDRSGAGNSGSVSAPQGPP
jgi:uncharacterized protein YceK